MKSKHLYETYFHGSCRAEILIRSMLISYPGSYPVKPESEIARARLAAEEQWLCFGQNLGIAAHVFRLGGIYGPGRSAVDTILKQGPMSKGQKARLLKDYTSRVHVADICQALHASILHPSPGKIYNIVDDDPAPREEVFEFARKLVEEKLPGRVYAERGEQVLVSEKPSKSTKRVSNARMKRELGVTLRYPSYSSLFTTLPFPTIPTVSRKITQPHPYNPRRTKSAAPPIKRCIAPSIERNQLLLSDHGLANGAFVALRVESEPFVEARPAMEMPAPGDHRIFS
ncbi:hypothetical protein SASPL_156020 [Salvia splendens]|uniref:NAD-dependent epimerase/dehydratase domain-containing protein n=1 Tax=Salvia splendens TaxID=180675 RepID=A0A8X8VXR7_SALSN|nr:hypothetical protein SASPL_156020 [Salvia splendens]